MTPIVATNGEGYEEVRVRDEEGDLRSLLHHRVLAFAWGQLDSVLFTEDMREVHHVDNSLPRWYNAESNLRALTPEEHREIDDGRAMVRTPWDRRAET